MRSALEIANQSGDLTFAGYSYVSLNSNFLAAGDPLVDVQRQVEVGLAFARKVRFQFVIDLASAQLGLVRTLRGQTRKLGSFDSCDFDELEVERRFSDTPNLVLAETCYWVRKLQAHVFAGDYAAAVDASSRARRLPWASVAHFEETPEHHFYGALARAACCGTGAADQRMRHLEALTAHHRQLQIYADNCPENFENRAALVGAEIARLEGREIDAERLYEQAIRSARANGFIHHVALAYELAARFYAARGYDEIARLYLGNARDGYLRWGADAKVRQLDETYPYLRDRKPLGDSAGTIGTAVEQLDLATVIKVSQAISSEVLVERLIDTLMRTAIEQAGAERGLLLLRRSAEQRIEAEATTTCETVTVQLRDEPVADGMLPVSVLHYVLRTRESVILDDAAVQTTFAEDPYIRQRRTRSILCMPLLNQAKLTGVLYLENNLAPRVFAPARIAVLKLLASQAAIALEKSRSADALREMELALAHANRLETMGQLTASIAHEVNQPIAATVTNAQAALRWLRLDPPDLDEVRQALDRIVRDGARAGAVVQRIRSLSKKASPHVDQVEISAAAREVIELTRSETMKNGVSVRAELSDGLPQIRGDRVQLQQVILNLILNAIEAMSGMKEGARELVISTGRNVSGDILVFVRDSGPGLPPADQDSLFKAFYTTKPNGLGLGLSICRSIVEGHGGRLWASANAPGGAVFQFTLPVQLEIA